MSWNDTPPQMAAASRRRGQRSGPGFHAGHGMDYFLVRRSPSVYPRACLADAGALTTTQRKCWRQTEVDVTAEAAAGLAADFANLPSWTLDERQLGDTELLLTGAFAPLAGSSARPTWHRLTRGQPLRTARRGPFP